MSLLEGGRPVGACGGLPEASVILARSMPMPAVAGHGGEFGGGPLSDVTVTGFAGLP